jgi:hypothetical protein
MIHKHIHKYIHTYIDTYRDTHPRFAHGLPQRPPPRRRRTTTPPSLVRPEGAIVDIKNLTPERKAYLKSLLETDGDNGDTQFDEDMGSPLQNSPGR